MDRRRPIGRYLVDAGVLGTENLVAALEMQARMNAPLGEILIAEGLATEAQVLDAVAQQYGLQVIDLMREPPDPTLELMRPPEFWLRHRVVPWVQLGDTLVLATARPDQLDQVRADFGPSAAPFLAVVASETQIMHTLAELHADHLSHRAETRVADDLSCRNWGDMRALPVLPLALLVASAITLPGLSLAVLSVVATISLLLIAGLKIAAFVTQMLTRLHDPPPAPSLANPVGIRLPKISVLVPLFREREIASALIRRLNRLTYPKALLDVVLVLEAQDQLTRAALQDVDLPPWMRVVEVPDTGCVTTKPRALNYALDFCKGDIIGIWDPDQLERVAIGFANAAPEVACLQGALDYYNPRTNWLSRCFTIEYASWWRVLLPGVAAMGLIIPLGGTTLFFRRPALERLGGWDAHNVTEDADLGVRLARYGYRTELIATVTREEANCHGWAWVKQRSRWLKGFMMTYLVHMSRPLRLWRDVGAWKFLGLQAFFLGTVSQFLLAPVLWSFWLMPLAWTHPAETLVAPAVITTLCVLFVSIEVTNMLIGWVAIWDRQHRFLALWVPTLPLYFMLGALAAAKALAEMILRPYFWDKTQHGRSQPDNPNT